MEAAVAIYPEFCRQPSNISPWQSDFGSFYVKSTSSKLYILWEIGNNGYKMFGRSQVGVPAGRKVELAVD